MRPPGAQNVADALLKPPKRGFRFAVQGLSIKVLVPVVAVVAAIIARV